MTRFLVVGDANVDVILSGLTDLPILGQELEAGASTMVLGGSAANTASWLAGLGAEVELWAKVGRDVLGDYVVGCIQERGVDASGVIQDPDVPTGICVALSYPMERALVSHLGAVATLQLDELPVERLGQYHHLHSSSIFIQHGLRPSVSRLFEAAKDAGLTTSLDCGWDPANQWDVELSELLRWVDVFLPNESEALHLTGMTHPEEALHILSQYCHTVVIKRGKDGALAWRGNRTVRVSALRIKDAESTGAGDCFNAGLLYALFDEEREFATALEFASVCGGIAASSAGGSSTSPSAAAVHLLHASNRAALKKPPN